MPQENERSQVGAVDPLTLKPRVPARDRDVEGRVPPAELSPSHVMALRFPWRVVWQVAEETPSLQSNIGSTREETFHST